MIKTLNKLALAALLALPFAAVSQEQQLTLRLHKNTGRFERTHSAGFGLEYALSPGRGKTDSRERNPWFLGKAGADLFPGRQDPTAGYDFRLSTYLYGQLLLGGVWSPAPWLNTTLTAGPGFGLYGGAGRIGFNGELAADFFVSERMLLGASFSWRKFRQTESLQSLTLRIGYALSGTQD